MEGGKISMKNTSMEVTKMSNTKRKKEAAAGQAIDHKKASNPTAAGQAIDHPTATGQDPATMQDKTINSIRGKAFESLCGKDGAFSSMFALNPMLTSDVVQCLLDFCIVNSDEAHPIDIMKNEPSIQIWNAFFQTYNVKIEGSETNKKNPQQSYRNMLATFPSKIKYVMLALDECGLKNNWIVPTSRKKVSFSQEDEKEINALLQKAGVFNSSMELKDRYKVFKALGGRLSSRAKKQQ